MKDLFSSRPMGERIFLPILEAHFQPPRHFYTIIQAYRLTKEITKRQMIDLLAQGRNKKLKEEKKMKRLKEQNVSKCFSLLREFINETSLSSKKEMAVLALNQLQKISAGTGNQDTTSGCHGRPMA